MVEEDFQKEAEKKYGIKIPTGTAKDIRSKTRQQAFVEGCNFRQKEIDELQKRFANYKAWAEFQLSYPDHSSNQDP